MEDVKPNYNCSQDVLYAACELIVTSLDEELVHFTDLKSKYSAAFVTGLRADLVSARAIPALSQRQSEQEVARIALVDQLRLCLDKLNALRLYIRDGYSSDAVRRVRMDEAGFDDYAKASEANWEKLVAIMNNASAFLALHAGDLTVGDNMPATFKVEFDALKDAVHPAIVAMLNMRENNKQGTSDKLLANNRLYGRVMDVCEDGVYIFRNDAAKASQFVWNTVCELVTPPGAAGLRGVVRDDVTSVPIGGALVELKMVNMPAVVVMSDAGGQYSYDSLPVGAYAGRVTKDGYEEHLFDVDIKTGVTSGLQFFLKAVV